MGPWQSDLPFGKPEGIGFCPSEIDVTTLTDREVANLVGYRRWEHENTTPGHPEYEPSARRLAEAVAEQERRDG